MSSFIEAASRPSELHWADEIIWALFVGRSEDWAYRNFVIDRARRVALPLDPLNEGSGNPINDICRDGPERHSPAVSDPFIHAGADRTETDGNHA